MPLFTSPTIGISYEIHSFWCASQFIELSFFLENISFGSTSPPLLEYFLHAKLFNCRYKRLNYNKFPMVVAVFFSSSSNFAAFLFLRLAELLVFVSRAHVAFFVKWMYNSLITFLRCVLSNICRSLSSFPSHESKIFTVLCKIVYWNCISCGYSK